jgi:hypothetical protein
MKPPFWEVTIRRQAGPSQPPVIESVNCFGAERDAENFRLQALNEDSSLRITIRLVTPVMPSTIMMGRRMAIV